MAKLHSAPFEIPDVGEDVIILEMENEDIVLEEPDDINGQDDEPAATDQPATTDQPAMPATTETIYTPSPGETLIAQNQVAGFSLISVVLFVICGIIAGFEVFKIWTHQ